MFMFSFDFIRCVVMRRAFIHAALREWAAVILVRTFVVVVGGRTGCPVGHGGWMSGRT